MEPAPQEKVVLYPFATRQSFPSTSNAFIATVYGTDSKKIGMASAVPLLTTPCATFDNLTEQTAYTLELGERGTGPSYGARWWAIFCPVLVSRKLCCMVIALMFFEDFLAQSVRTVSRGR